MSSADGTPLQPLLFSLLVQLSSCFVFAMSGSGGDDLDARARAGSPLSAHRVADGRSEGLVEQSRHASCGGARGDAPGLGDDDAPVAVRGGEDLGDQGWDEGRLAGAGRSGDDDSAHRNAGQQLAESGEGFLGGQRGRGGE